MTALFETFPYLRNTRVILRKMTEADVEALEEITGNPNVYKYIPPFLYKKSRGNLLAAIRNCGGRDFDKKKHIIAGVYLSEEPERLAGLAEMFDYKVRKNQITIGYRLNETYWGRGIATDIVALMKAYLCGEAGIRTLKAFVMPENSASERVLLKNGFVREPAPVSGENWGGRETAILDEFTYNCPQIVPSGVPYTDIG